MKKIFAFILFLGTLSYAFAQDAPVIKFEVTHHDFGTVKEEGGTVSYVYKLTNSGTKALKIERVQASCGCTSPDWTKEEILPGKEGFVKATFDPSGRPGHFSKSLIVYANTTPNTAVVTFGGDVTPKVKTFEDSFPASIGNLRFIINHVNFGQVKNNLKDTVAYMTFYSTATKPMTIKAIKGPNYITSKLPFTIYPRKETKYAIHYDATLVKDYGVWFDQMKLITDDDKDPEKQFSVIAEIHQYVPQLTDRELEKAPQISFDKMEHDFKEVNQGDAVSTKFVIKNIGKQNLELYKVKTSCGCTVAELEKKSLKPGESTNMRVVFATAGKQGDEKKDIVIYCNDPKSPEPSLRIKAKILAPVKSDK
jgi:hypothetical protein